MKQRRNIKIENKQRRGKANHEKIHSKNIERKEKSKMAVLAKPSTNLVVVDAKSSRDFIKRFNENTITPKMLESCAKASRLFKQDDKKS